MRILARKLGRELRRQRVPFGAVALTIALGVAVFAGATDAYQNLQASFDELYQQTRLADVAVTGGDTAAVATAAARVDTAPLVMTRHQADIGLRIGGDHQLIGRIVGQRAVGDDLSTLMVREGRAASGAGEVVVEYHLADRFGLGPGSWLDVLAPEGWRRVTVTGVAVSGEYLWPARSNQELFTTPELFGAVFAPDATVTSIAPDAPAQVLVYAPDRAAVVRTVDAVRTAAAAAGATTVTPRAENPSVAALAQDVDAVGTFATILPVLFLVAAALGGYVLLSRLVHAQRAVIGTLLASGMPRRRLIGHYLGFGAATGVAGALVGILGGVGIGAWYVTEYTTAIGVPIHVVRLRPLTMVVAVAVGAGTALVAAWVPARAAASVAPAEAMRAFAPSGGGRRTLIERVVPGSGGWPARWRMVVRNLARNRRRSAFTMAGVVLSVCLVLSFWALVDTTTWAFDTQFHQVQRQDAEVFIDPSTPGAVDAVRTVPGVDAVEPYARHEVTIVAGDRRYDTLVLGVAPNTSLHRFDPGADPTGADGVVLTASAARQLAVTPGTVVTLHAGPVSVDQRVSAVTDEPFSSAVYVSLDHLAAIAPQAPVNGALLRLAPDADRDAVRRSIANIPGVVAYLDARAVEQTATQMLGLFNAIVGLMLLFGTVMAFALLFNATAANTAERSVELGTLRAAGFSHRMLARLVATENLLLTAAAIPIGLVAGYQLGRLFIGSYEIHGQLWTIHLRPLTLVLAAVAVASAAVVAQIPVPRALRRIDVARIVRERSL